MSEVRDETLQSVGGGVRVRPSIGRGLVSVHRSELEARVLVQASEKPRVEVTGTEQAFGKNCRVPTDRLIENVNPVDEPRLRSVQTA